MVKIVIRVPNHLGDTIMSQGAVRSFVEMSPDYEITLLLPDYTIPVYKDIRYLKFLPLDKKSLHGMGAVTRQIKMLASEKFDIGVVLTPSFSSALVLSCAGIMSRYGYDGEGRGILLNNKIPRQEVAGRHRSQRYRYLLERVAGHSLDEQNPKLEYAKEALFAANEILIANGIDQESHYITIAPQAVAKSRRWGSDNYRELAFKVIDDLEYQVVLVGTASEFEAGEEIRQGSDRIINLCGKTNIEQAGAVMSMSSVFVGNDSGLAHLAAAVQVPLVVLSGADNPVETSPLSDKKKIIIKDELECISCVKNNCRLRKDRFMQCMKLITVEEVFEAAENLIQL